MKKAKQQLQAHVQNIKWHFTPPRSPNFGGIWEAGIKVMKTLMKKMVEPHPLKLDELMNVITSIEALMNSRPLLSAEGVELEEGLALTPAHFLIYRPMKAPPPTPAISAAKKSHLSEGANLCKDCSKTLNKHGEAAVFNHSKPEANGGSLNKILKLVT